MQGIRGVAQGEQELVEIVRGFKLVQIATGLRVQHNAVLLRRLDQPLRLPVCPHEHSDRSLCPAERRQLLLLTRAHHPRDPRLLLTQHVDHSTKKMLLILCVDGNGEK